MNILIKESSLKTIRPNSDDKLWLVVMKNGDVRSGNLSNMKALLKSVGVAGQQTKGVTKTIAFPKHNSGQAYHLSKSTVAKTLGVSLQELEVMGMKKTKWTNNLAKLIR